jgi:hypothetical protein
VLDIECISRTIKGWIFFMHGATVKTASLATAEPSVGLTSNQAPLRSLSVEQCYRLFSLAAIVFDQKVGRE